MKTILKNYLIENLKEILRIILYSAMGIYFYRMYYENFPLISLILGAFVVVVMMLFWVDIFDWFFSKKKFMEYLQQEYGDKAD